MPSMNTHTSWRAVTLIGTSLALSLGTLGGCQSASTESKASQDDYVVTRTPSQGQLYGRPTFDAPITLNGSNCVLVPFAVRSQKSWWRDNDPYSAGGLYARSAPGTLYERRDVYPSAVGGQVRWHNAIIRDMATGQERLVLNDRGIIGAWAYYSVYDSKANTRTPKFLAFVVVARDTNRDGEMNDLDGRVLMVCEPNGTNLRAITPEDSQVLNMQYDMELDALMIQLGRDTNRDWKITDDDVSMPYIWRRGVDQVAVPLVSDETRGRVERVVR